MLMIDMMMIDMMMIDMSTFKIQPLHHGSDRIENGYRDSCVLRKIYLAIKFSDKSCNFSVVGTHLVITGIVSKKPKMLK